MMENITFVLKSLETLFNFTTPCDFDNPSGITPSCFNDREKLRKKIHEWLEPQWYEVIFLVMFSLIFLMGLLGNFLVCFVIWRNAQMRTVTNVFIFNLAIADFMVLLFALPPTVIQDVFESWLLGDPLCKLVKYIQRVSVIVSVLTLTAIAIERYEAICYPLRLRATVVRARIIIVTIWLVALSVCIPELVYCSTARKYPEHVTPYLISCRNTNPMIGLYIYIIVFFLIPVAVVAFCYARIAKCLWSSKLPSLTGNEMNSSHGGKCGSVPLIARRRTAKMLIVVVLFFFCCYLPVYIINILVALTITGRVKQAWTLGTHQSLALIMFTHLLVYVNSAINPVIYNFMSEKFRKEFRLAWSCCWGTRKYNTNSSSSRIPVELSEKTRENITKSSSTRLLATNDTRGTSV